MKTAFISGLIAAMMFAIPSVSAARAKAEKRVTPSKTIVTEKRTSAMNFTQIHVSSIVRLTVEDRNDDIIVIRANENVLPHINLSVYDDKLTASLGRVIFDKVSSGGELTIEIAIPNNGRISSVKATGAAKVDIIPHINASTFDIDLNGAAKLGMRLTASRCTAEVSGAAKLDIDYNGGPISLEASGAAKINGTVEAIKSSIGCNGAVGIDFSGSSESLELELSGASSFHGFDFRTRSCKVEASGASNAEIFCSGALSAGASGMSKIVYTGGCGLAHYSQSGMGKIKMK